MKDSQVQTSLVSIIVPNYNHAAFLTQRLDSILNQTYTHFEVIVLDDYSTDNSLSVIESYRNNPKITHIISNTQNSGSPFKQWAKGIELANGDYVWIAESDDFSDAQFLKKVMERFASSTRIDIVFTGITNIIETGEEMFFKTKTERSKAQLLSKDFTLNGRILLPEFLPDICLIRNVSCAVFKKNIALKHLSGLHSFKKIGDFYFWIMLCLDNRTFSYISDKLNYMRNHIDSVRSKAEKNTARKLEFKLIYQKIAWKHFYNLSIMKPIIKYYRLLN